MIEMNKIYQHMGDDLSRRLYGLRILYNETQDDIWLRKIVKTTPEGKEFLSKLYDAEYNERIIFGTGAWGKELAEKLKIEWNYFVDNYKKQDICCHIPVLSFAELCQEHRKAVIIIATRLNHKEILQQLLDSGFRKDQIINMGKMIDEMSRRQYFDLDIMPHSEHEVFVDCGCFDGATSHNFVQWCNERYDSIYAFEPDSENYIKCQNYLSKQLIDKVNLQQVGLWENQAELRFSAVSTGSSCITDNGEVKVNVDALDKLLDDVPVTFIKMDIEGAELAALKGGYNLIKKFQPNLAISIYHKTEDVWTIPNLLLEIVPTYRFFVRHYSVLSSETVLYAIPQVNIV